MPTFKRLSFAASMCVFLGASVATAQSEAELEALVFQLESALEGQGFATDTRQRAGIAAVPSGFALSNGTASVSLSGSRGPDRGDTNFDASTAFSVGFGDDVNAIGVNIGIVNTSFRNFGGAGFFTAGVSRQFSFEGGTGSVALSASNLMPWGEATLREESATAAASFVYDVGGRPVMATIGAGTHLTRDNEAGLLGGFGVAVAPDWAVSAGFVGDSPIVGASYFPAALQGSSVNFSVRDLDQRNDALFGVDIGYSFNLFGQ